MRVSAVVALLSAGLVSAALLPRQELPTCAQTCIAGATTTTTCELTDNTCLCADQPFVSAVTECITTNCTGDDLTTAIAAAQAMCADSGVTLSETSTGASSTGTSTTRATTTGTASTTRSGTTTSAPTTSATGTATAPATTSSGAGNGALNNGVSAAAIAAVVLGAIAL